MPKQMNLGDPTQLPSNELENHIDIGFREV